VLPTGNEMLSSRLLPSAPHTLKSLLQLLHLLLLLLLLPPPPAAASAAPCAITTETPDIVADNNGQLCSIADLAADGCCPQQEAAGESQRLLASLCNGSCCSHYAACVHKCMRDEAALKDIGEILNHNRFRGALTADKAAPFAMCRDVCRTHSGSVLNGNTFISDFRFCYGSYIGLPPPPLKAGITIVAGEQGASCDDACSGQKLRCSADALPSVNSCPLLTKHFKCKNGCSYNFGGDQPAYVSSATDAHAGKCLINSDPTLFSCGGKHGSTSRLCPCA